MALLGLVVCGRDHINCFVNVAGVCIYIYVIIIAFFSLFRLKMRQPRLSTVLVGVTLLVTVGYIVTLHRQGLNPLPRGESSWWAVDQRAVEVSVDQIQTSDKWPVL